MRLARVLLASALVVAASSALPQAADAAAPSAPYTALTLDGSADSNSLLNGTLAFDASNAQVAGGSSDNGYFVFGVDGPTHNWNLVTEPPSGTAWVPGTTYSQLTRAGNNGTQTFFSVAGDGIGCNAEPGSITVEQADVDPTTHHLTDFAATFTVGCETATPAVTGEVRWNSNVPYAAAAPDVNNLDLGAQNVGEAATGKSVTFTSMGPTPLTFGAAALGGVDPIKFAIGADTCSHATLAYGQTCAITVNGNVDAIGSQTATLTIPDNSASGSKHVTLAEVGVDPGSVAVSPASLDFQQQYIADPGPSQIVTITAGSTKAAVIGQASVSGASDAFTITDDTCSNATVATTKTCSIEIQVHPTDSGVQNADLVVPDNSLSGSETAPLTVVGVEGVAGEYVGLDSARILDTRSGLGAPKHTLGAGGTLHLTVDGAGGIDSTAVSAVVLNITETGGTASSYLSVFPTGTARPTASNLNFPAGGTVANLVTVKVGTGGGVDIYNQQGSVQILADAVGYYVEDTTFEDLTGKGEFQPVLPTRLLDTRSAAFGGPLKSQFQVSVPVDFGADVNPHVKAFAVNVTALGSTASGYLSTNVGFPTTVSTLNFDKGATVANTAIVKAFSCNLVVSNCPAVPALSVYNGSAGTVNVIVDIVGFYDDGTLGGGARFFPITPTRIVDTRSALGAPGPLTGNATDTITPPASVLNVPDTLYGSPVGGLAVNITAIAPTASTYLTVWPQGVPGLGRPTVSNLNAAPGQVVANGATAVIGPTDQFNVYNATGTTNVAIDVDGVFEVYPFSPSSDARSPQAKGTATAHTAASAPFTVSAPTGVYVRELP